MNKEIIKIALESKKYMSSSFASECRIHDNQYYAPRILQIMNQGSTLVYASSIVHSIRIVCNEVIKYEEFIALCCFFGVSQTKVLICKDTEYFKPVSSGKFREVLIRVDYAYSLIYALGYDKKKAKKIFGNTRCFYIEGYTKHISIVEAKKANNDIKDKKFYEEISMLPSKYEPSETDSGKLPYHQLMQERIDKLKINATEAELHFKSVLEANNIEYIFQNPCIVKGRTCIMDFFLPKHRICIEVDGGYHLSREQLISDKARDHSMALCGILTIRFTNEEVMSNRAIHDLLPVLGIKNIPTFS